MGLRLPQQNQLFLEATQLSEKINTSSVDPAHKTDLLKRFEDIKLIQQELRILGGRIEIGECVLDCIPKYRKLYPGWETNLKSYMADAKNSLALANPQQPFNGSVQAANNPNVNTTNSPIVCGNTAFNNLSTDQGKALKFLLEKKYDSPRVSCITYISSTDKFPLRGQTVVKYKVTIIFPNGFRTDCLEQKAIRPAEQQGFNSIFKQLDCSGIEMAPAKVGETRTFSGEEII